ncbi:polar amino acid transport system permease protein [Rahnella sp. BIGb0603]|jgi:polar amino acid transport system permease protein|uniref:amino acid ABC transporter permease n=1 Tax=Rahnella sp. BIGb0603 TaxID=2940612 RepID=UPI002166E770|nr:amino acid ABC transporter permease [Rahnella sp. BIGb0603]MCS3421484.1 polar amino acid transport system permease protein [Rahnella sp. BIGb0603]
MSENAPTSVNHPPLNVVPARYPWRVAGAIFSVFILLGIVESIATNSRWEWGVFRQWFFDPVILSGLGKTLLLTLLGTLFGIILGTALALARLSKSYLMNALAWGYIWLFRSLPLLLVLIILYNFSYLYDSLSLSIPFTSISFFSTPTVNLLDQFSVAVLGLSLVQSAYTAEIIRGGILGVEHGQHEAAAALGLPAYRRTFRIILPQALRSILPTGFNEVISLAKGTSIVYVLSMPELFYTVQVIYNRTQQVIPLLMVATVWYLLITTVLSVLQYYVERYFSRGTVRQVAPTPLQRLRQWRIARS